MGIYGGDQPNDRSGGPPADAEIIKSRLDEIKNARLDRIEGCRLEAVDGGDRRDGQMMEKLPIQQ